ncbi:unnamed protein product [marine sediment metagenome]|uniref:Branched-chain amino acid ATP-binding cassette transporter C-terminal domain-containing protein n=1 Tax=marine sediment metagenome TaxID=412755 RepID=X1RU34_9ZZZZ
MEDFFFRFVDLNFFRGGNRVKHLANSENFKLKFLKVIIDITIAEGNPVEIQHNPEVIKAYLGVEAHYA